MVCYACNIKQLDPLKILISITVYNSINKREILITNLKYEFMFRINEKPALFKANLLLNLVINRISAMSHHHLSEMISEIFTHRILVDQIHWTCYLLCATVKSFILHDENRF